MVKKKVNVRMSQLAPLYLCSFCDYEGKSVADIDNHWKSHYLLRYIWYWGKYTTICGFVKVEKEVEQHACETCDYCSYYGEYTRQHEILHLPKVKIGLDDFYHCKDEKAASLFKNGKVGDWYYWDLKRYRYLPVSEKIKELKNTIEDLEGLSSCAN